MRVAWVVPRFGPAIAGGAEGLCRAVALRLAGDVETTVLTTCATDYTRWTNALPAGEEADGPLRVLRFPVARPRDEPAFQRLSHLAFRAPRDVGLARRWVRSLGPDSPALLEHLREAGDAYDVVCFVPYLYATTALGVHATPARRVLVPCAHDEPPLRLAVYDDAVAHADAFSANTPEEAALLGRRFGIGRRPVGVMGVGVEPPAPADPERFRAAFGISGDYVVCVSRVDPAKGVHLLARRFGLMRRRLGDVTLVLIGPVHEPVPPTPGVVVCGFVDEAVKHDAIAGARALILPSAYESLSIATLEAWLHGRPTVVNAGSDVLVGQTRRSGGGLWFRDAATLEAALLRLLRDPALGDRLGASGRAWTREHVGWERVRAGWLELLGRLA